MESYENFVISAVSYAWNLRPQKQVSEDRSPHDTSCIHSFIQDDFILFYYTCKTV